MDGEHVLLSAEIPEMDPHPAAAHVIFRRGDLDARGGISRKAVGVAAIIAQACNGPCLAGTAIAQENDLALPEGSFGLLLICLRQGPEFLRGKVLKVGWVQSPDPAAPQIDTVVMGGEFHAQFIQILRKSFQLHIRKIQADQLFQIAELFRQLADAGAGQIHKFQVRIFLKSRHPGQSSGIHQTQPLQPGLTGQVQRLHIGAGKIQLPQAGQPGDPADIGQVGVARQVQRFQMLR